MPAHTPSRADDLRRLPTDAFVVYAAGDAGVVIYDRDEVVRTVAAITRVPEGVVADAVACGPTGNPFGTLHVIAADGGRSADVIFPRRGDTVDGAPEQDRPGRYGVSNSTTVGFAWRTDVLADAERCAAAIGGRVFDTLPADRPRLDTALEPRFSSRPDMGAAGPVVLVGLASDHYRISAVWSDADAPMWQATRTAMPRVRNLGTVASLDVAITLVARDAGDYADAWRAAHPAAVRVDGLTYVRSNAGTGDGDEHAYVWLADAHGADGPTDPIARAVLRDSRGVKPARWAYVETDATVTDPESGHDVPVYLWRTDDGVVANDETAALLDAALRDVDDQFQQFAAADALMGDARP